MLKKLLIVLLLCVGVYAQNNEELGKPYISFSEGKLASAVVAPKGKRFYTLKDGLITHWQLEPLKKLYSFQTNIEKGLCNPNFGMASKPVCNVNVSSDEKRLIIRSYKSILLFDLERKVLLDEVKHKSAYGIWDGTTYITFSNRYQSNATKNHVTYNRWEIDKTITKSQNGEFLSLCPIGSESTFWSDATFTCDGHFRGALIIGDSILIMAQNRFSIYDKNTFKLMRTEEFDKTIEKRAYLNYKSQFIDLIEDGNSSRIFLNKKQISKHSDEEDHFLIPSSIRSISNDLALYKISRIFMFILPKKPSSLSRVNKIVIHQFNDGEAVLWVGKGKKPNQKYSFEATPGARKYLKMKNSAGTILPINDRTYKQYNRQIKF